MICKLLKAIKNVVINDSFHSSFHAMKAIKHINKKWVADLKLAALLDMGRAGPLKTGTNESFYEWVIRDAQFIFGFPR
jgi:hypothetical protein